LPREQDYITVNVNLVPSGYEKLFNPMKYSSSPLISNFPVKC